MLEGNRCTSKAVQRKRDTIEEKERGAAIFSGQGWWKRGMMNAVKMSMRARELNKEKSMTKDVF